MGVKFVPVDPKPRAGAPARDNLAQVIDLRAKITDVEAQRTDTNREVQQDATKILARKAMSSGELRLALSRRDHDSGVIDEVIDEFERRNFLDDMALAEALTEKLRRTKHASRQHIALKLRERQIPRDVADEVLEQLDRDEEHELMREVATERARKLTSLDRVTAERRLAGFLQRRGWGGPALGSVIREALDAANLE